MTSKTRIHTPETDARFTELWNEGATLLELGQAFGIATSTAGDWRDRLGLEPRFVRRSDPEREQICDLWRKGLSASEIARQLGSGKSRNAVIGVVYRAGLSGKDRAKAPRPIQNIPRVRKPAAPKMKRGQGEHRTAPKSANASPWGRKGDLAKETAERKAATIAGQAILAAATDEPGPEAVRMFERRIFGQCAWPVGEATGADQLCCGKPIPDGASGVRQSYCAGHGMRAVSRQKPWTPTDPRQGRPDPRTIAKGRVLLDVRHRPADELWDVAA